MDIHFVSTLTPEDEDHLAGTLLKALATVLDETPLAYTLRIQTSSEAVYEHSHPEVTRVLVGAVGVPSGRPTERSARDTSPSNPPAAVTTIAIRR